MGVVAQINALKAAAGDPAMLALASVDLAYGDFPEQERERLREALEAASVPHWVDESVLALLVGAAGPESAQLLARLRSLRLIEAFPARGAGAVNVHQASRIVLRESLRRGKHERFVLLSVRAREAMVRRNEIAQQIEALYHHFAIDQEAATSEWEALEREVAHPLHLSAIAAAMDELGNEGWLEGAGKAAAILSRSLVKMLRGESIGLEAPAREAIALGHMSDRSVLVGFGMCVLGEALSRKGDFKGALEAFRTYLEVFERLANDDPKWYHEVAVAHSRIADVEEEEGKLDAALSSMQTCLAIIEELVKSARENWNLQREVATTHNRIAQILQSQRNLDAALEHYRRSLDIHTQLTQIDPSDGDWQRGLASGHRNIGTVLYERKEYNEALEEFSQSRELFTRLAVDDPSNINVQRDIASATHWIGSTRQEQGDLKGALDAYREGMHIMIGLVEDNPQDYALRGNLARMRWNEAAMLERLDQKNEAMAGLLVVEGYLVQVVQQAPDAVQWQHDLTSIREWIANRKAESSDAH
jgi:tetratricopeptide (TPR) repeat protein